MQKIKFSTFFFFIKAAVDGDDDVTRHLKHILDHRIGTSIFLNLDHLSSSFSKLRTVMHLSCK